jgi:rubrerythrin
MRDWLSAVWADWQGSSDDERTRLISGLAEAWRDEDRSCRQIRQLIPAIPYEQFRRRLDGMARDDERHATLVHERLTRLGGMVGEAFKSREGSENRRPSGSWRRLQQILGVKRELYERYRQAASSADDLSLQSLLGRLRDDEARHQEELVAMLMQLDAHVHESLE